MTSSLLSPWHRRFLALAVHVSSWSKDPTSQVGAVIVANDDRRRVAFGYNGFPPGIEDTQLRLYDTDSKNEYMQHAERNALDNCTFDTRGAALYVTRYPCHRCAGGILSNQITTVITAPYPTGKSDWIRSCLRASEMFQEAGVSVQQAALPRIARQE